jgi:excisionase family DNA binding protein
MNDQTRYLLTVKEVQRQLSFSRTRVYELLRNKVIMSQKVGRRRMILAESVLAYVESLKIWP